ncbi:hypothetical protein VYU27_009202 [Nannochloropsis oceanica]
MAFGPAATAAAVKAGGAEWAGLGDSRSRSGGEVKTLTDGNSNNNSNNSNNSYTSNSNNKKKGKGCKGPRPPTPERVRVQMEAALSLPKPKSKRAINKNKRRIANRAAKKALGEGRNEGGLKSAEVIPSLVLGEEGGEGGGAGEGQWGSSEDDTSSTTTTTTTTTIITSTSSSSNGSDLSESSSGSNTCDTGKSTKSSGSSTCTALALYKPLDVFVPRTTITTSTTTTKPSTLLIKSKGSSMPCILSENLSVSSKKFRRAASVPDHDSLPAWPAYARGHCTVLAFPLPSLVPTILPPTGAEMKKEEQQQLSLPVAATGAGHISFEASAAIAADNYTGSAADTTTAAAATIVAAATTTTTTFIAKCTTAAAAVAAAAALETENFHPIHTIWEAFPFLLHLNISASSSFTSSPSSTSAFASSFSKLDVPGLSNRLVLHHSVQPLDLLMGTEEGREGGMEEGTEGGMEQGMEGGNEGGMEEGEEEIEERFSRLGSPLFMEEEDVEEWHDHRPSLPPSFLQSISTSIRAILGSAMRQVKRTWEWIRKKGEAGTKAMQAMSWVAGGGAKNTVAYALS